MSAATSKVVCRKAAETTPLAYWKSDLWSWLGISSDEVWGRREGRMPRIGHLGFDVWVAYCASSATPTIRGFGKSREEALADLAGRQRIVSAIRESAQKVTWIGPSFYWDSSQRIK